MTHALVICHLPHTHPAHWHSSTLGCPKPWSPDQPPQLPRVQMVCRLAEHRPSQPGLCTPPFSLSQPSDTSHWPVDSRPSLAPPLTPGSKPSHSHSYTWLYSPCCLLSAPGPGKSRTFQLDGEHDGACPAVPAAISGPCSPRGDPGW